MAETDDLIHHYLVMQGARDREPLRCAAVHANIWSLAMSARRE